MNSPIIYLLPLIWALVLLASFIGYGSTITRLLKVNNLGWGFNAVIGLSAVTVAGGPLLLFSCATRLPLIIIVLIGAGLSVFSFLGWGKTFFALNKISKCDVLKDAAFAVPIIVIASTFFLASINKSKYNEGDDGQVYFGITERILQTGNSIDPFSFRRAVSLGGYPFIQATYLSVASYDNAFVVDRGIARLILAGVLIGLIKPSRKKKLGSLVGCILLLLPDLPTNTFASMSLIPLLLSYGILFAKTELLRLAKWSDVVLMSLLAVAATSYRPTAAFFIALSLVAALIASSDRRKTFAWIGCMCGLGFVFAISYFTETYLSSATPFLPPFNGNVSKEFLNLSTGLGTFGSAIKASLWLFSPIMWGFLACALCIGVSRFQKPTFVFYLTAMLTIWFIGLRVGEVPPDDYYRYTSPIMITAMMLCLGSLDFSKDLRKLLIGVLLIANVGGITRIMISSFDDAMRDLPNKITGSSILLIDKSAQYQEVQSKVAAGEGIMLIVPDTFYMDFNRNPIFFIDVPTACSPLVKGRRLTIDDPKEFKKYLLDAGISNIIAVDFNKRTAGIYGKQALLLWAHWASTTPPISPFFNTLWAPTWRSMYKTIEILEKENPVIKCGDFTVIKLK